VLVLGTLVACIPGLGDCDMKPLAVQPIAAIGPAGSGVTGGAPTSCASMVTFDGVSYYTSGGDGTWNIDMEDLEPIGLASAANDSAWNDATVFEISGVGPPDAVAMLYGPRATISVLLTGDVPASLCPYLAAPEIEPVCAEGG
jgi:hypothetical protein